MTTALAAGSSWLPHHTWWVMAIPLFRLHVIECSGVSLLVSGRSVFPTASGSSGSLTRKFDFSENPSPSMVPRFSGQALILWMSSRTAPQAWRSCLQVWSHYIHEPFHSPRFCPHLMHHPLHRNWEFHIFISWQMQAPNHLICSHCYTQVSRWHISYSKKKNKEYLPSGW